MEIPYERQKDPEEDSGEDSDLFAYEDGCKKSGK